MMMVIMNNNNEVDNKQWMMVDDNGISYNRLRQLQWQWMRVDGVSSKDEEEMND
jgi:hypothetical protein